LAKGHANPNPNKAGGTKQASPYIGYLGILRDPNQLRLHLTTGSPQGTATPITPAIQSAAIALLQLDDWLAANAPLSPSSPPYSTPTIADLKQQITDLLHGSPPNSSAWNALFQVLCELLYAALILSAMGGDFSLTDSLGLLTRWLPIMGLVNDTQAQNSPIKSPNDIYAALRWRTIILPDYVVSLLLSIRADKKAVIVRQPGFADLFITREEWDHYEAAEVASIENILGKELKSRVHILVNQIKTTTTTDQTTTSLTEQDITTTDLNQLQQQASSDIAIAAHVDAQVNVSAQYGTAQINSHVGGSLDFSDASTSSKAVTQSHETVARAVSKMEQITRQIRTVSNLTRSTDKEEHTFDNKDQSSPVVGIYRWVNQIQNVELDRYPHRFLMEFEIPEPGAWMRWLLLKNADRGLIHQPPLPLTLTGDPVSSGNPLLQPGDLTDIAGSRYYGNFVSRYSVRGVSPPPTPVITIAANIQYPQGGGDITTPIDWVDKSVTNITVPTGYYASGWRANFLISQNQQFPNSPSLWMAVGAGTPVGPPLPAGTTLQTPDPMQGNVGPISRVMFQSLWWLGRSSGSKSMSR
jgi:hypothetical protein